MINQAIDDYNNNLISEKKNNGTQQLLPYLMKMIVYQILIR